MDRRLKRPLAAPGEQENRPGATAELGALANRLRLASVLRAPGFWDLCHLAATDWNTRACWSRVGPWMVLGQDRLDGLVLDRKVLDGFGAGQTRWMKKTREEKNTWVWATKSG